MAIDELASEPWLSIDGASLVSVAAGLQLLQENIEFLIRLQRLAGIGAILPCRERAKTLSASKVRALLGHQLVSGPEIIRSEDPYADLYSMEIPFSGRPHLVLQGLTDRSGHTLKLLLDSIFGEFGENLPDYYREIAYLHGVVFLRLSNEMCNRAGIPRGFAPISPRPKAVSVPGHARLTALAACTKFDFDELSRLLPQQAKTIIRNLAFRNASFSLGAKFETDDRLILRPLLALDEGVQIANPGELASSLRHHLILGAVEVECVETLAGAFAKQVMEEASRLIQLFGGTRIVRFEDDEESSDVRRTYLICEDKFIELVVVTDDLNEYSPDEPYRARRMKSAGSTLNDTVISSGFALPNKGNTLRLIVIEGVGRDLFVNLTALHEECLMLRLALDELKVMLELYGGDPLFLWRFAQADNRLRIGTVLQSWSILDNFACYKDNSDSFYLDDNKRPSLLSLEVGYGLSLRIKAQQNHDVHLVSSAHGSKYVRVHSLYGVDTAPIYASRTEHEIYELLVEIPNTEIWVGGQDIRNPKLFEITRDFIEATAFWIWQINLLVPSAINKSGGPENRIYFDIKLIDPEAWIETLRGEVLAEFEGPWVQCNLTAPGQYELLLNAFGLRVLASAKNDGDRDLVRSLLHALFKTAGTETEDLAPILEKLAPVGNKRMLRVLPSFHVTLRRGDLPTPRFLQQAITSNILDEVGELLTTEGYAIGPIAEELRTSVLNRTVAHLFERFESAVSELSVTDLVQALIKRDEALIHFEAYETSLLPSRIACFGEENNFVEQLAKDQMRLVEASVASRFLIEYVSAKSPLGDQPLTLDRYDHLLALAVELVQRGFLSDAIRHGFSETKMSMLDSGRLGASRGERMQTGTKAMVLAYAAEKRKTILEPPRLPEMPSTANLMSSEVEIAMMAEFGFDFKDMGQGISELIALGDKECESEPFALPLAVVEAHLIRELSWTALKVSRFLDALSLGPRDDFSPVKRETYPWRYNREWSYIRRPLIKIIDADGGVMLVWGARRVWIALKYWAELVYSARLQARTDTMKSLMGRIKQRRNSDFEVEVRDKLKSAGFDIAEVRVSKISGKKLVSVKGSDLGDIDILGICISKREVLVVEAKDYEFARTPTELANEASSLFNGEKSADFKLKRRTDWIKSHLALVLSHYNIYERPKGWTVSSIIVTSNDLMTPKVLSSETEVVVISALNEWLNRMGKRR